MIALTTPAPSGKPGPLQIARSAVALLGQRDVERVHQCEDHACGWVFIDTSPRQNRRWCVSAECGNRNRVRLHYQRRAKT